MCAMEGMTVLRLWLLVTVVVSCLYQPAELSLACNPSYYQDVGQCTETCPEGYIGNYSNQQCQPFPDDYRVLFNATGFHANISADTPLGTPIFQFQVVINTTYFGNGNLVILLSLTRNMLVEEIFKFENGGNEEEIQGGWSVETIFLNRSVIYASEPPASVVLPADLEFTLSVVVDGATVETSLAESTGFVTITEAADGLSCEPGLFRDDHVCTETCPLQHYGNYSSGKCQPFPDDYRVLFNATGYHANISADTPLGTPIFQFQVVINNTYFGNGNLVILLSLTRNMLVEEIFMFENGGNEEEIQGGWSVETIFLNRSVIYASEPPASVVLPADLELTLSVVVDGAADTYLAESNGFVTITEAVDDCKDVNCFNGTCVDGKLEFECACHPGYTGSHCDSEINECVEVNCSNGVCISMINNFTCDCYRGWEGEFCETNVDDCDPSPCSTNGTLQCEDGNGTATCVCDFGFTGQTCSIVDLCTPELCKNNATCITGPGNTTSCGCSPGYTGEMCESLLLDMCSPDYCLNNGTCQELEGSGILGPAVCLCLHDFTGPQCNMHVSQTTNTATPPHIATTTVERTIQPPPVTDTSSPSLMSPGLESTPTPSVVLPPTGEQPSSEGAALPRVAVYGIAGVGGLIIIVIVVIVTMVGCMVSMRRRRATVTRYRQSLDFSAFSANPAALDVPAKDGEDSSHNIHDLGSQGTEWDINNGNKLDYELMFANPAAEQF